MAEVLVKEPSGDVVAVQHDDFHWGRKERDRTRFRILIRLGERPESLQYLLARKPGQKFAYRYDPKTERFVKNGSLR